MVTMKLILSSNSPRRKELLAGLDIPFEVRVIKGFDESFPDDLPTDEIAEFVSKKKAAAYAVAEDEIVITADTIVVLDGEVLGKPRDLDDAAAMLRRWRGSSPARGGWRRRRCRRTSPPPERRSVCWRRLDA